MKQAVEQFNQKLDTYQKVTQRVVQLVLSLIAAATVTIISRLHWVYEPHQPC